MKATRFASNYAARYDTLINLADVVGLGHEMTLALRWFAIGFAASLVVDMLFNPPLMITVICGVLAGFTIGAITMMLGDWIESLLSKLDD